MPILNGRTLKPNELPKFDICIVGAGAVGFTMAKRLYRSGLKVVVLDSGIENKRPGGNDNPPWTERRWIDPLVEDLDLGEQNSFIEDVRPHFLTEARTRCYGGSTNCWGGFIRPMDSYDFKLWNLQRKDIESYYKEAMGLVKLDEFDIFDDPDKWNDLVGTTGVDNVKPFDSKLLESCGLKTVVIQQQSATVLLDFQEQYGWMFEDSESNLTLIRNATALWMIAFSGNCNSIHCRSLNGRMPDQEFDVKADKFVLAMGGLEIPRFLLISKKLGHFSDNLPKGVGNNYLNHPKYNACAFADFKDVKIDIATRSFYNGLSKMKEQPNRNVQAFVVPTEKGMGDFGVMNFRLALIDNYGPIDHSFHVELNFEMAPKFNTPSITLSSKEVDIFGLPRLNLDWTFSEQDSKTVNGSIEMIHKFFEKLWVPDPSPFWKQMEWIWDKNNPYAPLKDAGGGTVYTGDHHLGTCGMDSKNGKGVVDSDCKIIGQFNTWICSTAVFPTGSGWANSTLTLLALALRLADHLAKK